MILADRTTWYFLQTVQPYYSRLGTPEEAVANGAGVFQENKDWFAQDKSQEMTCNLQVTATVER